MKSGAEIYLKVMAAEKTGKAVRRLKDGSLRSLILRLKNPHGEPPCEKRDRIEGIALVEAAERWVKAKGKGLIL